MVDGSVLMGGAGGVPSPRIYGDLTTSPTAENQHIGALENVNEEEEDFSSISYWRTRYSPLAWVDMEWLVDYKDAQPLLMRLLPSRDCELLIPGCGNSQWPVQLFQDGFKHITCLDFAAGAVVEMSARYADLPIDWVEMDARNMDLPGNCCDAIIDKALLDCQACTLDEGDYDVGAIRILLTEMHRVLKRGGVYLCFSHGEPGTRLPHVRDCGVKWNVLEIIKLPQEPIVGFDKDVIAEDAVDGQRYTYLYVFEKL